MTPGFISGLSRVWNPHGACQAQNDDSLRDKKKDGEIDRRSVCGENDKADLGGSFLSRTWLSESREMWTQLPLLADTAECRSGRAISEGLASGTGQ